MKKVIGVSASQRKSEGFLRDYINNDYTSSIEKVGGIPLILPITSEREAVKYYISCIDGLILSGGHDVDPAFYKEELLPESEMPHRKRDTFDMLLIEYALIKGIPILGICRGMQVLNVYFGGSLYQDLKYNKDIYLKHMQNYFPGEPVHRVKIDRSSVLAGLYDEEIWVNSYHHQQVKEVGKGLRVTGWSADMGAELIEYATKEKFIVGVQWHPEMMCAAGSMEMEKIFEFFYNRCFSRS